MGDRHGIVEKNWAVYNSRKTFTEFMERMNILEAQDSDLWIAIANVISEGGVL